MKQSKQIAIVGYSCRVPGASGREAFWELLTSGRCAVSQITGDRFAVSRFAHPTPGTPGRSYTFAAGLIEDVWGFDARFFGISPREAVQMDPQQRHLLEVAYEALEHAGIRPSSLAGSRTGVYVGASSSDYMNRFLANAAAGDVHMMTGNTLSIISNRLSYAFDLRGPSLTVDTACSSSLVAMHLAAEAIRNGEIDTAIVGGASLLLSPFPFIGFARASMLSPTGLCRSFDALADGYVRGEGIVAVVLRAADSAKRNGDHIHAIVAATASNTDGRTAGLALPSADSQAMLLQQVYEQFEIDPCELAFVEAHGTGTPAGDPIEANALGRSLGQRRSEPLLIGSVKTNLGHLEPASGLAGVVKSVMALDRKLVPKSLHFETPSPNIPFEELNLAVASGNVMLPSDRRQAYAGINSFGFGGANAHVVLRRVDRAEQPTHSAMSSLTSRAPLVLSAQGAGALKALAERYQTLFSDMREEEIVPVAMAAGRLRDLLPDRLVVQSGDATLLATELDAFLSEREGIHSRVARAVGNDPDITFVFSGNGSQWVGMGRVAFASDPLFRAGVEEVDRSVRALAGWSVVDTLVSRDLQPLLREAECAQCLLLAVQVGIVRALAAKGVRPAAVIGHSVGEIAAAWAAGALDIDDAVRIVLARSACQEGTRHLGGMAAVLLSEEEARRCLDEERFGGLEIAAINSSRSVTISGPNRQLDAFLEHANEQRWGAHRLDLDYPYHCALVEPFRHGLTQALAEITPRLEEVPIVSSVIGKQVSGESLNAAYWWENVRQPVRLRTGLDALCRSKSRVFVEIGPRPILTSYLHDSLRTNDIEGAVIETLSQREIEGVDQIEVCAASILARGGKLDLDRYIGVATEPPSRLPSYAWQHEEYRVAADGEAVAIFVEPEHPLLGHSLRPDLYDWFTLIDPLLFPWLSDHRIDEVTVFPAAAFVEQFIAAARMVFPEGALEVRDLDIFLPMVFQTDISLEVRVRVSADLQVAEILSRPQFTSGDWSLHARASIARTTTAPPSLEVLEGATFESEDSEELYQSMAELGYVYGPLFRRGRQISLYANQAHVLLTAGGAPSDFAKYAVDPTSLDAAFHGVIVLADHDPNVPRSVRYLPTRIGRLIAFKPGVEIVAARIAMKYSSEHSLVADVVLLDASGEAVLSASEVRFRAVRQRAHLRLDDFIYSTVPITLPDATGISPMGGWLKQQQGPLSLAGKTAEGGSPKDVDLLLSGAASLISLTAARMLADDATPLSIQRLVEQGRISVSAVPFLSHMLLALVEQGYAKERENTWIVDERADIPPLNELIAALLIRFPDRIAEAACLARLAEVVPSLIANGLERESLLGRNLLDHLDNASPAVRSLQESVLDKARHLLKHWPSGRQLRVLVIGAQNAPSAIRLAHELSAPWLRILVTDADTDRLEEASRLVLETPQKAAVWVEDWDVAIDPANSGYDLVLASDALHRVARIPLRLEQLARAMRPGGALVGAELLPSLFWDLVRGTNASWWAGSLDPQLPIGALQSTDEWRSLLAGAGFEALVFKAESTSGAMSVFMATSAATSTSQYKIEVGGKDSARRTSIVVLDRASIRATLAERLALQLTEKGRVIRVVDGDDRLPDFAASMRIELEHHQAVQDFINHARSEGDAIDLIYVADGVAGPNDPVGPLARQSLTLTNLAIAAHQAEARLWLLTAAASPSGVDSIRGPEPSQAALWSLARVLRNEFPELNLTCLDVTSALSIDRAVERVTGELSSQSEERELHIDGAGRTAFRVVRGGVLPSNARAQWTGPSDVSLGVASGEQADPLVWQEIVQRAVGPDDVEIEVAACGLNFRDVMWSLQLLPPEAMENGISGPTLGMECAGLVTSVGRNVTQFRVGDRVVAFAAGAMANRVVTPCYAVATLPDTISLESAATLPVAFITAYYGLAHLANLSRGETLLIHGGAGGVGLAALQIAKLRGATTIVTAGSPAKRALLHQLGADHVLDSRSMDFANQVKMLTGGAGVDVVLNSVAGEAMQKSLECLRSFGRFLELGKRDYYGNSRLALRPFRNNLSYFGIDVDQLLGQRHGFVQRIFGDLMKLFKNGALAPLPYRVFASDDAADGFRLMQRSGHIGKIVILPPKRPKQSVTAAKFVVDPAARYLIVGGLGGFGLATAQWLASKGARHLVLMSRSGAPTDEAFVTISALRAADVEVEIAPVDVADSMALASCLDGIAERGPILKGIFHAAMVIDDRLAASLDRSAFEAVLRPKVAGAQNLDRLTRRFPLDYFVLFSSATVLVGNPGQANYVTANGYLDALARRRRAEGLPALSVGWGAISDAGYLSRNAQSRRFLAKRLGNASLLVKEALTGLEALLSLAPESSHPAAVTFARIDWRLAVKELATVRTPLFEGLRLEELQKNSGLTGQVALLELLQSLPADEAADHLTNIILTEVGRTLRLPEQDLDRHRPLAELGMDSLMMLEFRSSAEEAIGIEIPLMSLTSQLTAVDIGKRLVALLKLGGARVDDGLVPDFAHTHLPAGAESNSEYALATAVVEAHIKGPRDLR